MTFVLMFQHLPAGHLHHRVHVFRESEAVFEKDKEKSQDHERKGVPTAAVHELTERVMLTRKFSADLFLPLICFCIRQAWKRWCTQILSALRWAQRLWRPFLPSSYGFWAVPDLSAVTCTPASPPSSMATSPVTPFSSSTTVSSRSAQVGAMA